MKHTLSILITALLIISSCTTSKYVVGMATITVKGSKVSVKPLEKGKPIADTVMNVMVIRKG